MRSNIIFVFMYLVISLSLYSQNKDEFHLGAINNDFIGVYLPIEYIDSLKNTKNHSLSLHLNDKKRYHDVFAVDKNIIYSNLKWHDQYAIKATEVNSFQFTKKGEDVIIIDNNGYSYKKIGNNPNRYSSIVRAFVGNIIFEDVLRDKIGLSVLDDEVVIPFLYSFTAQDSYTINLDDMFYEKNINILLYNRNDRSCIGLSIEGGGYLFYKLSEIGDLYKKSDLILKYNLNEDKRIIYALSGLIETSDIQYLNGLTDYDKRVITNAMFASNGYSFATEQWQVFFNKYSWYKPNKTVENDPNVLNIRQKKLLDYLNQ
jgi:hypothetical protein